MRTFVQEVRCFVHKLVPPLLLSVTELLSRIWYCCSSEQIALEIQASHATLTIGVLTMATELRPVILNALCSQLEDDVRPGRILPNVQLSPLCG